MPQQVDMPSAAPGFAAVLASERERMARDIVELVEVETPTGDRVALRRGADAVEQLGRRVVRAAPSRVESDGRTHLLWRFGSSPTAVLLLAHYDTVWPIGSLTELPCAVSDGILRGPGCFDMKTGLVMALHAVRALESHGSVDGLALLVTADEEIGSPSSRKVIEEQARGCRAALVLEAAGPGGAVKTERKGAATYRIEVRGRAAHAGLEPERGVNAGVELARQVLAVQSLSDPERGTSVTPTTMSAGSTRNTVPESAHVDVDVRVRTAAEEERVQHAISAFAPETTGASVTVTGGPHRPPLTRESSAELFHLAQLVALELELGELEECAVGGASDGNLTAGIGVPTLDGLGAVGGGAHARDEHVVLKHLVGRTTLLAGLIHRILSDGGLR